MNSKNFQPQAQRGFADLTNDFMFKRIFGREESKDVLITFLNHFIGNGEIVDVEFLNPEQLAPTKDDKISVFDISIKAQDGTEYIIKMQVYVILNRRNTKCTGI